MRTYAVSQRPSPNTRRPLSACLLALALALVAVGGIIQIAPSAWTALHQVDHGQATFAQCAAIADGPARLACYDKVESAASAPPAKGADALLPSH
jgi:hypothetical protein